MFLEIEYKGVSKVSNQMISGRASVESDGDVYRIRGEEIIPCTLRKAIPLKTEPQYFENDMVLTVNPAPSLPPLSEAQVVR